MGFVMPGGGHWVAWWARMRARQTNVDRGIPCRAAYPPPVCIRPSPPSSSPTMSMSLSSLIEHAPAQEGAKSASFPPEPSPGLVLPLGLTSGHLFGGRRPLRRWSWSREMESTPLMALHLQITTLSQRFPRRSCPPGD